MEIRHPDISDYDSVLDVMVDWWGGRDLRSKVYKGLFIHFTTTSFIVVDEDGTLVGFLLGFLSQTHDDQAFINWVGVHPDHRNRGIARDLYQRFFNIAREHGRHRVTSSTSRVNEASMRWHRKMGFSVETTEDTYLFSREI